MAKLLKLRRGTTSQHSSFTGAEGEVTVDTDKEALVVHNGSTAGGFPVARADGTGVTNFTITGELDAATLDISGNADVDGTLEADAYTVDGTALNEYIADTVGAMVTGNTETGIAVTYEDGDNTLDFVVGTLNQNTTGTAAIATEITATANNSTNETVYPTFVDGTTGTQGIETDTGLTYNPNTGLLTTAAITTTGNVTVGGNLQVDGTTTTVNSSTMTVTDKNIEIAKGAANDAAADGGGITLDSGDGDKEIKWVNATDYWTFNQGIETTAGEISIKGAEGNSAILKLTADEGDDNADYWRLVSGSNGNFTLDSKSTGSWVTGLSIDGSTNATFSGDVTFTGAANNVVFDASDNALEFADNAYLWIGTGNDIELWHDGTDSNIKSNTGQLKIRGSDIRIKSGDDGETMAVFSDDGACELNFNNIKKIETTAAGVTVTGTVSDTKGDLRHIPQNAKSSAYTLVAADAGQHVLISSGGVTVPDNVFSGSGGEAITIINNSGSDQTITQGSGVTMYNTADASTGNRTLAARGMATLLYTAIDNVYISGSGLS